MAPHLVEACRVNLALHLYRDQQQQGISGRVVGVCDPTGLLREGGPRLLRLLREEWPRWKPSMPLSEMLPALSGSRAYTGRAITITVFPLDDLSPRERDVAKGLLEGLSYKDIARRLGLSCSTVTNLVNRIYAKLSVHNGVQLARLARR